MPLVAHEFAPVDSQEAATSWWLQKCCCSYTNHVCCQQQLWNQPADSVCPLLLVEPVPWLWWSLLRWPWWLHGDDLPLCEAPVTFLGTLRQKICSSEQQSTESLCCSLRSSQWRRPLKAQLEFCFVPQLCRLAASPRPRTVSSPTMAKSRKNGFPGLICKRPWRVFFPCSVVK